MEIITSYTGKNGQDIVIAEMDDYHLANAFNYFARRLVQTIELFQILGSAKSRIEYETDVDSMEWLKSIIYSLGKEAEKRGRKSPCKVCDGYGVNSKGAPCLICCGTGWYLGETQKELNHARKEISVG